MSETMWMVRAGEGGYLIDEFARGFVAIGWNDLGDLSPVRSLDEIRELYDKVYPEDHPGKAANAAAMVYKFRSVLEIGSKVVTYDTDNREYLVGTIESDYYFKTEEIEDYAHLRKVVWMGRVSRDLLTLSSRNSLGVVNQRNGTLFEPNTLV